MGLRLVHVDARRDRRLGQRPRLAAHGQVDVDTAAPDVTVGGDPATVPLFTPNGDGSRDTVAFTAGSSEPGSVVATVRDADSDKVDSFSARSAARRLPGLGRQGWIRLRRGRPFEIAFAARDRAGNTGAAQVRSVDAYGALGYVSALWAAFFDDGDANGRTVTLGFRLDDPATVSWTIVNAAGDVVRTLKADEALAAGLLTGMGRSRRWGSLRAARHYRSLVHATDGTLAASQAVSVVADAFKVSTSDASPGRKQRITVTATSAEALDARPRLAVYQPGIAVWRVADEQGLERRVPGSPSRSVEPCGDAPPARLRHR